MSYPGPIRGSAGKRCRVLLGQTASDYIFLANNDDGNITWQSHEWNVNSFNGIPGRLINRINECSETGQSITDISFGTCGSGDCFMKVENFPDWWDVSESFTEALMKHSNLEKKVSIGDNGSWLILYGDNGYSSCNNLSSDLWSQLEQLNDDERNINFVRLLPHDQYFISYSDGIRIRCEWNIMKNKHLSRELNHRRSDPITDVAIARDGSWIVLRKKAFTMSDNVPIQLQRRIKNFYSVHRKRVRKYRELRRQREQEEEEEDDDHHRSRRRQRRQSRHMRDDRTDREPKRRRVGDFSSSSDRTSQSNRIDSNTNNNTRNDDEPFDLNKCVEKIDIERLKQIKENLATDSLQRRHLLRKFWPMLENDEKRRLQSCSELEDLVKKLYEHVKDLPRDPNGYVEYEVEYVQKDLSKKGRLYAKGIKVRCECSKYPRTITLQGMHKDLRAPLVGSFAHDIDCVNSEVNLLCSLAIKLNLKDNVPTLFDYRERRQEWISSIRSVHGVSESNAKLLSTIVLNGGQYDSWKRAVSIKKEITNKQIQDFVNKLKSEVGKILFEAIYNNPSYSWLHNERMELIRTKAFKSRESRESSLTGMLIRHCENEVLNIIHRCFFDNFWIVRAKIFDGLIVEKSDRSASSSSLEQVMKNAEACCESQGWYVELAEKPLHGKQDDPIVTIKDAYELTRVRTRDIYHNHRSIFSLIYSFI